MKKVTFLLAAVSLVGLTTGTASAQCSFNSAAKAKGVNSAMVRAYAQCGGTQSAGAGTTGSSTNTGVPACAPVLEASNDGTSTGTTTKYSWGAKGSCTVKTSGKIDTRCQDNNGPTFPLTCSVVTVQSKCAGILKADGVTPIDDADAGWQLKTLSRATLDDQANGDVTVIDFSVPFSFGTPKKGGLKLKGTTIDALSGLGSGAALPNCTAIEIISIKVSDPLGNDFAVLGGGTKDKDQLGGVGPGASTNQD